MLKYWRWNGRVGGLASVVMVVVMLLTACVGYGEVGPVPTLGSVSDGGGRPGRVFSDLTASTNCAEVGEVVMFTLHVRNDATFPITLTGSPVLEIVIQPFYGHPNPIQRWSDSDQYPAAINPLFVPGEDRTYVWRWTADAVYALNSTRDNGVKVISPIGVLGPENQLIQGGPMSVNLGIHTFNYGNGATTCAEMPRS